MEAARVRWANRKLRQGTTSIPQVVATLDIAAMERRAGSAVVSRGRAHMVEKRGFELGSVSNQSATVDVRGNKDYLVTFELADGNIFSFCECSDDDTLEEVICEHKIAAAMFLQEQYTAGPKSSTLSARGSGQMRSGENGVAPQWKEQLTRLLQKNGLSVQKPRPEALLFFSFIRRNHQFVVQPGMVSAAAIPPGLWRDRAALSEYLLEHQRDPQVLSAICVLPFYQSNSYHWLNAAPGHRTFLSQVFQQLQWAYSGQVQPDWEGLANALVFRGNERELIKEPLEVLSDLARIGLEMRREAGNLRLSLAAVLPDRRIELNAAGLEVIHRSPLWLCKERQLFQAGIDWNELNLLSRQAEVIIPSEALAEFYQLHFQKLAEAFDVRTDGMIETLAGVAPQPRVYLTEQDRELRVLLRFSYNGLECIAVKNVPPQSYARDPERDVVVKIERQAEVEKQWWQRLGNDEFSLKCGNTRGRTTPRPIM